MAVYKIEKCRSCGYKRNEPNPKKNAPCPKCGLPMTFLDNWYISYTHKGRKYVEAVGLSKRMAEDAHSKKRVEIREKKFFNETAEITWTKAADYFSRWIHTNCKPGSVHQYENSIRVLTDHFKKYTLNQITAPMVERFKTDRLTVGKRITKGLKGNESYFLPISNATVNRDVATLKRIMSIACSDLGLEVNRISGVEMLSENNVRIRSLTGEEESKLIAAIPAQWLKVVVIVGLETGLRKESIVTLRWIENIDFKNRSITQTGKGDKRVTIPMTDRLYNALTEWKAGSKVLAPWVFPSPLNERKDGKVDHVSPWINSSFDRAAQKAGLGDFTFHDLSYPNLNKIQTFLIIG